MGGRSITVSETPSPVVSNEKAERLISYAAVGWNVNAKKLDVESPAGGQNYCFGCIGTPVSGNNGTYVSTGTHVEPKSLFAAQLADRGFDTSNLGL